MELKSESGLNRFTLSAKKWIEKTGALGIIAKAGRYGSAIIGFKGDEFVTFKMQAGLN